MSYKVMITDTCFPDIHIEESVLSEIDAEIIVAPATDEGTLIETGRDCDAIIFDYAQITKNVLDNLSKCKVAVRYGIGVNTIDMEAASENKIMVANIPDYCWEEVSDHTITLALACARRVIQYNDYTRNREWDVTGIGPVHKLEDKYFCLYGFGHIAQRVVEKAKNFGFKFAAYDPYAEDEIFEKFGVERVESLKVLAEKADVFSIHAPLTQKTENSVNKEILDALKPTAIVINTSRGPLIKEEDLIEAIKNKKIMGAGLDVLVDEPPKEGSNILELDNVIVTPHVAFYSVESENELRKRVAEEVMNALIKGSPKSFLNREAFKSIN